MTRMDLKRWTKSSLRTLHLLALAGVGGGVLFGLEEELWLHYWWLALASGGGMMMIDWLSNPLWIVQVRGVAIVLKLLLLLSLAWHDGPGRLALLAVIVVSGLISHAPGRVRYYSFYHKKTVTSDADILGEGVAERSALLSTHAGLLASLPNPPPLLDLACGDGRNGLWLAERGLQVVFADRSQTALQGIARQLRLRGWPGHTWQVDLEQAEADPLAGRRFSAILVFNYLHRPLFPALAEAVAPGGLLIYQTFTVHNRRFGRPRNPDYLLHPGELRERFREWQTLHYFEGVRNGPQRAVAELVARKPAEAAQAQAG